MLLKLVFLVCLVAYARAGDLLQHPLIAAPAPLAQIRYAPAAPLISKSTIYHPAPAPALAYHASAPAVVAAPQLIKTIAPAPIAYHAPAPAVVAAPQLVKSFAPAPAAVAYHASAPAAFAYHAQAPAAIAYHAQAPAAIAYHQAPAIAYQAAPAFRAIAPAPLVKTVAAAPLVKAVAAAPAFIKAQPAEEYDPNPQYSFGYDVQDSLTGDVKSQSETRSGDTVQGSYALNEPDGTRRIVDYTADPVNGFNAIVRKEPLEQKAIIAPVAKFAAAPVALAAPALRVASPVAKLAYAASAPALLAH